MPSPAPKPKKRSVPTTPEEVINWPGTFVWLGLVAVSGGVGVMVLKRRADAVRASAEAARLPPSPTLQSTEPAPVSQAAPASWTGMPASAPPDPSAHPASHNYAPMAWTCPFCRYQGRPAVTSSITAAGWILFILMLFSCIGTLFCWLPLMLNRVSTSCPGCHTVVGGG